MRRIGIAAVLVVVGMTAQAAQTSCKDRLAHVLNFGVPRTSLDEKAASELPNVLAGLVEKKYSDPCKMGKNLQINLTFGSDYEVLDWIERGSVDGGIVPELSLWLIETPLREVNAPLRILDPRLPAPSCYRLVRGQRIACDANATYDALLSDLAAGGSAGTRRVMFASHLSSTGFLAPLKLAAEKLTTGAQWEALFAVAHFTIDTSRAIDPFKVALSEEPSLPADLTIIVFPGEEVLARGDVTNDPNAYREHLVVSADVAKFFDADVFVPEPAKPLLPEERSKLLLGDALSRWLTRETPPSSLGALTRSDRVTGVRNYSFTIHESMRLLAQQQRSSGESELALVLPGGGVKAAYQSRIVDHLYEHRDLRNGALPEQPHAIPVRSILGTSGGALLGYFVAQLGETGPFDLYKILWEPDGRLLEAHDVFNVLDMLRYTSVVWTFAIFCALLALFTGTSSSKFYGRAPTPYGSWRFRLMTLLAVFLAVPILIRFVSGGDKMEHVPVIEGIFYAVVTVVVMFCDQCLVHSSEEIETRPLRDHAIGLAGTGVLFVLVAIAGQEDLQAPVAIGFAFATLSIIFLGGPLLLLYANGLFGDTRRRLADVFGSLVAVMILCSFGVPGWMPMEIRYPFALLMLLGLAGIAYWNARQEERRKLAGTALTFLTLLAVAILCWPQKDPAPGLAFITTPAMEETNLPPFLASTGCLLMVVAAMVWVYQRREYSIRDEQDFSLGLGLLIVHALATGGVVALLAQLRPDLVQSIELTASFWIALTIAGGVFAVILLLAAPRWPLTRRALRFLTAEHPNGSLLPRRYTRMLAVAVVSLVWWNTMMAPALYGNDPATEYLEAAVERFDRAFPGQTKTSPPRGFVPTTRFVAPTNTLQEIDATRYFAFLTKDDRELALPRNQWKVYRVTTEKQKDSKLARTLHPRDAGFVQDVILSSGSPFPILAAHRVTAPGDAEPLDLIDGGYSNDIPIGAARRILARQVLVIHSAPALVEKPRVERSSFSLSPGLLIRNAQRLPSFMFEHGQEADRLSRQNLFVIGLAPVPRAEDDAPWPGLAQFDRATVKRMRRTAEDNLDQRIGIAESWGEPRFRFSQQIPPKPVAAATKAGPG